MRLPARSNSLADVTWLLRWCRPTTRISRFSRQAATSAAPETIDAAARSHSMRAFAGRHRPQRPAALHSGDRGSESLYVVTGLVTCYECTMQVIVRRTLKEFWARHPQAEGPIRAWLAIAAKRVGQLRARSSDSSVTPSISWAITASSLISAATNIGWSFTCRLRSAACSLSSSARTQHTTASIRRQCHGEKDDSAASL